MNDRRVYMNYTKVPCMNKKTAHAMICWAGEFSALHHLTKQPSAENNGHNLC